MVVWLPRWPRPWPGRQDLWPGWACGQKDLVSWGPGGPLRFLIGSNSLPKLPGSCSPVPPIEDVLRVSWVHLICETSIWANQPLLSINDNFEYLSSLHFLHWADRLMKSSRSRIHNKDEGSCNPRSCLFKSLSRFLKEESSGEGN